MSEQIMGNLSTHRIATAKPFSFTGVDFCGLIFVHEGRHKNSKHIKADIAVLVWPQKLCIWRSYLSMDAFLNAFKRFISRRGKPSDVFSDNGTLSVSIGIWKTSESYSHKKISKIIDTTSSERMKWHFIPLRASHFGGLWEAIVKSFKGHFYKVASEAALTFEEVSTLVIQIEAILNSRPLSALSSDPNNLNYLSLGHFLIDNSLISYSEPDITQYFWKRWSLKYLSQLQRRAKWYTNRGEQLKVGQLVLCRENGLPPLSWMLGRVQEVCPGDDNIIRRVVIKTARGIFKRPAVKLSVFLIESSTNLKEA
ncbi:uncharacterized protein LOC105250635 [Camponotus floridanus]|uniref:uncharacterized protein LOC105250635 n=1 Tax=Camponotus floridanus TaxID=104421 RepID=UPI00059BF7F2|nr:uncharacterized protein LOC105250635 [Camponotus floridanus]